MRHYRPVRAALLLLVAVAFTTLHLGAQTLAGVEQGIKPYGSYEGGNIDSISMVNGSLTLNIPLVSYSQRGGKLQMAFRLVYNNPWLQPYVANCNPRTKICRTTGYNLAYGAKPSTCEGGDETCGTAIGVVPDFGLSLTPFLLPGNGSSVAYYTVTDADNAVHVLGGLADGQLRSVDTTGYLLTAPLSVPNDGVATLWDRQGNIYRYNAWALTEMEDSDGNFVTGNTNSNGAITGWTDTLGRAIPAPSAATATNLTDCPSSATSATLWAPPGPNGGTSQYKFCWATIPISFTPPDCTSSLFCQATSTTATVMVGLVLPNLTSWTFSYDGFGEPMTITLPTGGGTISYTWDYSNGTCVASQYIDPGTGFQTHLWPYRRAIQSRTVNANDGTGPHTWTYSGDTGNGGQTIVTDPLGNETVDTETALGGTCSIYETESDRDNGSTPLEKIVTTYSYSSGGELPGLLGNVAIDVVPSTVTTTDETSGKTWQVSKTYDSGVPFVVYGQGYDIVLGDVLSESYSDWGVGSPGPLLKTTNTLYVAFSNSNYLAYNLIDLASSQQTLDGGGVQRAYTTYGYDEYALNASGITTQHNSTSPDQSYRGHQTSAHRWLNGSTTATTNCNISVSNGYLVSYAVYNDTGTVDYSVDSCGASASDPNHKTSYAYSATYVGAYPTTVTNPLGQPTTNGYDFDTGLLTSTTDPNQQTTSFTYDSMWRIASVSYPDGGSATITRQETTPPFSATLAKVLNSSQSYVETNIFDGLGRVAHHEITSDPQGTIYTDTTYDALGRAYTVSNPYRSTSDSTYGLTTYAYDPLSRTISVTKPDNSLVKTAYCGPATLVTDETGHWRRSTSDALGRLVEADEPNSLTATVNSNGCPGTGDPIWVTTYGHDALDDLTSVVQGSSRNRGFVFDSLKHLTTSQNPEAGTVTYVYDADSNVITKTDARSITTTYSYDVLNRATGETYSNGDPSVTYAYDQATCIGQSPCYNIGRRTAMTDAGGTETLSYDKMGREWGEQRTTNSVTKTTTYAYDLAGDLATLTYPSGRTVTYTYDSAERPSDVQDVANSINYAIGSCANGATSPSTGTCYAPQGAVAQLQNGTNLISTYIYNDRLQPCWMYATTSAALGTNTTCNGTDPGPGNILDLKYGFNLGAGDNGNVVSIANNRDTTRSQSFVYDWVNRITSGQTSTTGGSNCWGEAYSYDQWANLQSLAYVSGYSSCSQEGTWSLTATADNQLPSSVATYDAAGNTLTDNFNIYQWNAESEIKSAASVNYTYDGDGDRLEKSSGKIYWYGAGTEILNESDLSGNFTNEYVFFGGKRIAMRNVSSGAIYYYAEDMLGSSRTMVQTGQTSVCYDADFYPFGGERDVTASCAENYKFEGKERDSETQNDDFGARYYSWRVGRWLSADWSAVPTPVPYANLSNPQTLNLYAMVSDNPETFADLDGHDPTSPAPTQPTPPTPPPPPNLFAEWGNVIEVSGSIGESLSIGGQAGPVEGKIGAGLETDYTLGLGGSMTEESFAGASGSAKMAHVEVEAKAGVTVSSKDGVSVGAEGRASAGPEGAGVKVDKSGVHTEHGATVSHDTKLGVHAHAGLGLGVAVNLSQAKRALHDTATSLINAAANANRLINGVNPFSFGPGGGPNFTRPMSP